MLIKHLFCAGIVMLCIASCSKDKNNQTQRPPVLSYNVNSITDVQYGQNTTYAGTNQKMLLDIYSPKDASSAKKYPLVVMAHSGSFLEGDKSGLSEICQAIAEKGFITVSIEYRLGWDYGNAQSPAACEGDTNSLQHAIYRGLQDYNASLRFLVHNANTYFIDTSWIFIGGSSAGAVAAVNTIYTTPDLANVYYKNAKTDLGGLKNADNDLTDAFTIKGNVNLWGAVFNPDFITQATAVPMVAFHGSLDETVPIDVDHYALCPNYPLLYGSRVMYNLLSGYGVPAVIHIAEGQGHGPDLYQDADFLSTNIDCFLQSVMNKTAKTGMFSNLVSSCQ